MTAGALKLPSWYRVLAAAIGVLSIILAFIVLFDPTLALFFLVFLLALAFMLLGIDRLLAGLSGHPYSWAGSVGPSGLVGMTPPNASESAVPSQIPSGSVGQTGPTFAPAPAAVGPRSHAARNAGIVVTLVVIIILILVVLPLPHSFSQDVTTELNPVTGAGATSISFPKGSAVSGSYSTALGISALVVFDSSGTQVYDGSGPSGSFSFTASNPPYYFVAVCVCIGTVTVSGTYYSPII